MNFMSALLKESKRSYLTSYFENSLKWYQNHMTRYKEVNVCKKLLSIAPPTIFESLLNCSPCAYMPYPSLIHACLRVRACVRAYAPNQSLIRAFTFINKCLACLYLVLCCTVNWKVKYVFSLPSSLSSFLFYTM